ncbi:MAG: carboxypeptidase-like regulatory domain-containing protein [Gemmatimonadaceae bacterium]|nr:carboxypeptidase-like regulatory domain-containing protein [Chitinophagaceae bacterium]
MKYWLTILLLTAIFRLPAAAQTQDSTLISVEFNETLIPKALEEIEKKSGYRLFFDSRQFDTLKVSFSISSATISRALDKTLEGTDFLYAFDPAGKTIFISKGQTVKTTLPPNLFNSNAIAGDSYARETITRGSLKDSRKDSAATQTASLENKLYQIGKAGNKATPAVTVVGYIREAKTGEPITGASIQIEKLKMGVTTDQYGYYALTLPRGRYIFNIQSIGMRDTRRQVVINDDGTMDIQLNTQVTTLKNVIVSAQKVSNVKGTQMGMQKIDIKTIKQVPVVFGEADVLRVILTLPGVKTVGEASTGLNVRGGSTDQNLILFNDATIYNPSHFFGMFSAFNPEVVKDVVLYKSSIPARYGGRLSSVVDISSREGNKKNITGAAGIGLLTSRIDIEGPIIKDRSSFIIGGRTTYANWLLNLLPDQYKNSKAGFYDVNLNISHEINKKNTVYLTGYLSRDRFNLNSDTVYGYGNQNISFKWKHVFSNKLNSQITSGIDRYYYDISSKHNPVNAYKMGFDINQTYLKMHFNYYLSSKHTVDFGLNSIYYKLHPGKYSPVGAKSLVVPEEINAEQALESALYLNDKFTISPSVSVEAGIRYSVFNSIGPKDVNLYAPGLPKTEDNQTGTTVFKKGQFMKTYSGPEYRLSVRYAPTENFSIKAGYNTQRQYIHMLSNTASIAPTDIWKLSDPNIKPQFGDQVSIGFYKNFKSNTIETSLEFYYKNIRDYLDYKSGAVLVMNPHIETDVINTKGKAYGAELLIKKLTGKLNGWVSYTWSRVLLKMDDPAAGEIINGGDFYPSNYDKPHDVTLIGNYRINHRFSVSLNGTYSTGRPITLPIGRFYYSGSYRTLYADRNANRIPDYFRMDFSMNIEGNHKVHQRTHNSWTIGLYNLTGRKNPYSVYYVSEGGSINGYKLSIFGSIIPFVNFNIRFNNDQKK